MIYELIKQDLRMTCFLLLSIIHHSNIFHTSADRNTRCFSNDTLEVTNVFIPYIKNKNHQEKVKKMKFRYILTYRWFSLNTKLERKKIVYRCNELILKNKKLSCQSLNYITNSY